MFKKNTIVFIIIFIIVFGYNFFISSVFSDEIWNYGVAYNVSVGMIPYRDFNLVTTPLYPMLASLYIRLFGSYLYSFHIFNSIIISLIIFIVYKRMGKKLLLLFPFILLNGYPSYNILCVLLVIVLLEFFDKDIKYRDVFIGVSVGLMFLTKQTVGILLFFPLLFISNNKIRYSASFLAVILIFGFYLVFNDAFYQFIDYCFLGLFEFKNSNSVLIFLPLEIIVVIILIYKLFKSSFKDKRALVVLFFQVITVPILDDYHFFIGFIPFLYIFLYDINFVEYRFKYYCFIVWFLCIFLTVMLGHYNKLHFVLDKNSYFYGRNLPSYVEKSIDSVGDYIVDNSKEYDFVYFFSATAYWVKLNINYKLTKYDMICNGNMGYRGADKIISEVDNFCNNNKCMFILYKYEFREDNISQTNRDIVDYVKDNYNKYDEVDVFYIYSN